jgi:hypothetical protein
VRENQNDAAADEQRPERGEQNLPPANTGSGGIRWTVMPAEGVRRFRRQDAPFDQVGQLGVKPSHSLAHGDLIMGQIPPAEYSDSDERDSSDRNAS